MLRKIYLPFFFLLCFAVNVHAQPNFGEAAYEIALPTANGDTVTLSSLKGKIVLVDFWASWCGPCRAANRDMAKVYKKLKGQNFEILAVSLDEDSRQWLKAVARDKTSWMQVIDPGGWESKTARQWQLYQIPTNYLVNEEGVVIGKDLMAADVVRALKELSGQ